MIEMTPAARERLDDYLRRMRGELRAARGDVADEVEQSVMEHIEIALAETAAPVGETEMIAILDRLGSPEQWLAGEARADAENAASAAASSRLAYVALGLVVASIVLLPMFGFLLLIPAVFVSRAWIEQMRERGEPLGARRWLVYPSIALALVLAALLLLLLPPLFAIALTRDHDVMQVLGMTASPAGELRFLAGLRGVLFGSWWIIAGGICVAFIRPIRFLFAPLLDGLRRRHFAAFAATGAVIAAAGAALIYYRH